MAADIEPINLLIIGAGDRGFAYAQLAKTLDLNVRIVGVAEPREERRQRFAAERARREHTVVQMKDYRL